MPPARPAATVIVARDGDTGIEVLLLKRSEIGAFAGMWVFPGGRVDDADPGDDELARAASAAVREAMEEVSLTIDPASLIPLSHWTPPTITAKRYATWFFVAPWTGEEATIDDHEIVASRWITPTQAFAEGLPMAPPTWVTIASLAEAGSLAGLAALIDARGVDRFFTRPANLDGALVLLWDGDAGYSAGDASVDGERHRITLHVDAPPHYERTRYGISTADGVTVFHGPRPD